MRKKARRRWMSRIKHSISSFVNLFFEKIDWYGGIDPECFVRMHD